MNKTSIVPGRVTREMVHIRTHELALIAGRTPPHVSQVDYERAKRDLTGETDTDLQEAILDSHLGESRHQPAPGLPKFKAAKPQRITKSAKIKFSHAHSHP